HSRVLISFPTRRSSDLVKALNALVRMRSDVELDGAPLMQKVFSANAPVLRFNALGDESDRNEQQGFMMMFSGAVAGLRNPRAHKDRKSTRLNSSHSQIS